MNTRQEPQSQHPSRARGKNPHCPVTASLLQIIALRLQYHHRAPRRLEPNPISIEAVLDSELPTKVTLIAPVGIPHHKWQGKGNCTEPELPLT